MAKALNVRLAEILADVEGSSGRKKSNMPNSVWEEMKAAVDQMRRKDREWVGKTLSAMLNYQSPS